MKKPAFTHLDGQGQARMVDVSEKAVTRREAVASGLVVMKPATRRAIWGGKIPKGDVLATARLAGIQAAKRTSELIPLCHPLFLTHVQVDFKKIKTNTIRITALARATEKTGLEMEALTAVAVAALTIYDMCKAVDKALVIKDIQLEYKAGGKSGVYRRKKP